jgi:hypothetical protein
MAGTRGAFDGWTGATQGRSMMLWTVPVDSVLAGPFRQSGVAINFRLAASAQTRKPLAPISRRRPAC